MTIAREDVQSKETNWASSLTQSVNNGTNSSRCVLGVFANDDFTESLTGATDGGTTCTLASEVAQTFKSKLASLVGDANVATGARDFVGSYTDGNHKPAGAFAAYSGVDSIRASTSNSNAGSTGPTVTLTGLTSGDLVVGFLLIWSVGAVTYTTSHGTVIHDDTTGGSSIFRRVVVELTATGSSATLDGTISGTKAWHFWAVGLAPGAGAGATAVTLMGPSSGDIDTASGNFTVGVDTTPITGTLRVTPATDISAGGSFSPAYRDLTTGSPSGTFTFTPAKSGVHSISCTDDGGLTDPTPVPYTVTPKVRLVLETSPTDATPRANLTALKWKFWDTPDPADAWGAPVDEGTNETTDASGVIDIHLPDSTLTNGEAGWLFVTDSDGNPASASKVFSGPVAVT